MWLLRIVRAGRWNGRDPADAAYDLAPREGEAGISVYRVADDSDADPAEPALVAALFAAMRDRPDHADYVLVPESAPAAIGLDVVPSPAPDTHPFPGQRHHEILGLAGPDSAGLRLELARRLLSDDGFSVGRLPKAKVVDLLRRRRGADPYLARELRSPAWSKALGDP